MSRRNVSLLVSIAAIGLLLSQFQNCAPAGKLPSGASADGSGDVRLIDDYAKAELQFITAETQIHDEAPATEVTGFCNRDHSGASLNWAIWAGSKSSTPLLSGRAECGRGQFSVDLSDLSELVCGVQHLLVVEGDWGGTTYTHVTRRCQPLVSEEIAAPEGSPYGTSCSVEYQPAVDAGSRCTQVCYRDSKVVMNAPVAADQCRSLAAKLAGP